MQIHLYDSAAQVGQAAATLIAAQIIAKPDSVLGLATGSTPIPTYQELIRLCKGGVLDFSRVRSFNLDEYCNLPVDHEQSYHSFMRQQLFDHINIDPANTRVPDGNARDQAAECASYDTAINQAGGIDIQVLGIGRNGHIGFNEPADTFVYGCHIVNLTQSTIQANRRFFESEDDVPRQAISLGMKPVTAIKMATWNAAREYGLRDLGAVAAGYRADLVLLDSLKQMTVRAVYKDGRPVEERFAGLAAAPVPDALLHSVHFENVAPADLALPVAGPAHVIEMVPYQIVTRHAVEEVPSENGFFRPNAVYTKLCVVERHGKNGGVAVCPLKGYGITGGAIATSVAHDSHNVIAAGDNDADLALAINHLKEIGGGYVLAGGGKILGALPLRVGGLMSTAPWEEIQAGAGAILERAKAMGIPYHVDPFTSLSFLALPVIPELRLTDRGLFDVTAFSLVKD